MDVGHVLLLRTVVEGWIDNIHHFESVLDHASWDELFARFLLAERVQVLGWVEKGWKPDSWHHSIHI